MCLELSVSPLYNRKLTELEAPNRLCTTRPGHQRQILADDYAILQTMRYHLRDCPPLGQLGLLLACGCLSLASLPALPLASYYPAPLAGQLISGAQPTSLTSGRSISLTLGASHPAQTAIGQALAAIDASLAVESLFFWPSPPTPTAPAADSAGRLLVYNILRSVGSMQGIEYYSVTRQTRRVLYERSSLVTGADGHQTVADSWQAAIPGAETLYTRQDDASFGDNVYRLSLEHLVDGFAYTMTNLTAMAYGFIPVAKPGQLLTCALIILTDEGIIFYVVSGSNTVLLPGLRNPLQASFSNRARAIYEWFSREASRLWPNRS